MQCRYFFVRNEAISLWSVLETVQVSTPNWTQAIHCRCQICSQQDCHRHFQARFVPLSLLPTLLQSALAWDFGLERCIMLSRIWRDMVIQKLGAQVLPAGAWRCSFWFSYYQCLRDQVFRFGPRVHPSAWFANICDARWWVRVSDQSVWAFWRSGVAIVLLKSMSTVHRSHGCICTFCIFCTEEADIHLVNRCEVVQHVIESITRRDRDSDYLWHNATKGMEGTQCLHLTQVEVTSQRSLGWCHWWSTPGHCLRCWLCRSPPLATIEVNVRMRFPDLVPHHVALAPWLENVMSHGGMEVKILRS